MAEGLLLDYGGVLTTPLGPALATFCRARGLPDDAFATVQASAFAPELEAYERGEREEAAFLVAFARELGLADGTMAGFLDAVVPDETMFAAVAKLREAGVPAGLLSNSWGPSGYPRERLARDLDAVVISGEVGLRKPDPAIYALAAERLGVAAGACVFVDDTEANLAPARAAGMAVVRHRSAAATLRELERRFGVALTST